MATDPGRRGRRPGNPGTRATIVAAARELFAIHGLDHTSFRKIASAAHVDAALVHHYLPSKTMLFAEAVSLPRDPAEVLAPVASADWPDVPARWSLRC